MPLLPWTTRIRIAVNTSTCSTNRSKIKLSPWLMEKQLSSLVCLAVWDVQWFLSLSGSGTR